MGADVLKQRTGKAAGCEECRDLASHAFRSPDDLINALRVAAEEMNRGVLAREDTVTRERVEHESVSSALSAGAVPDMLDYRFRCLVCGARFSLVAVPSTGEGAWTREEA